MAVDEVIVAVTYARADHIEQNFPWVRRFDVEVFDDDAAVRFVEDGGFHNMAFSLREFENRQATTRSA